MPRPRSSVVALPSRMRAVTVVPVPGSCSEPGVVGAGVVAGAFGFFAVGFFFFLTALQRLAALAAFALPFFFAAFFLQEVVRLAVCEEVANPADGSAAPTSSASAAT